MNRILVTGATSMIGVSLIETALENGTEVYAVVRKHTGRLDRLPASGNLHVIRAELDALSELMNPAKEPGRKDMSIPLPCDVLYHFAWGGTSKTERDDPDIQERNIRYTLDAVRLARRLGCRLFVGAGSQAEYGPVDGRIGPDTRFAPVLSYGAAKYTAGILSRKLCDSLGILHAWGRIFSVYGRYDNSGTMLDYAIRQFSSGKTADFSSGLQHWDYLNERDAGRMFYRIGEKTKESRTYLIASGENRCLREYILELAGVMGAEHLCRFAPEEGRKPAGIWADPAETFRELEMTPSIPFREGIREMAGSFTQERQTGGTM